jgi:5'-methylthioinosine phosphorylase
VIGGTGLNRLPGLEIVQEHAVATPYGEVSHGVSEGRFGSHRLFFLARHGVPHRLPPHRINYRANLWALKELGASRILAMNAVGGIQTTMRPGQLVIPDQLVDYTWDREHTYFDGETQDLRHIDFTEPYDRQLRLLLIEAATNLNLDFLPAGTYAATQGPRLETAAEVKRLRQDGCDVVGMTGMPEAALAAELGVPYASICMVVNPAAGISEIPITMSAIDSILEREAAIIVELLSEFLSQQG